MNKIPFILLLSCITTPFLAENLYEVTDKEKVKTSLKWNSGMEIQMENISDKTLNFTIETGTAFKCSDQDDQNQVFFGLETIALKKGESKTLLLKTYCMEASDGAPSNEVAFSLMKNDNDLLQQLAEFALKNNCDYSSTMQSAVWSITDNRSLGDIYGITPEKDNLLLDFVAKLLGKEKPKVVSSDLPPHNINWLKGTMNFNAPNAMQLSMGIYDSTGAEITSLMKTKRIIPGYHTFKFQYNEAAPENKLYLVQLKDAAGNVVKEARLRGSDEIKETYETLESRFTFNWNLTKAYKSTSLAIFDAEGKLRQTIFAKRYLPAGKQAMKYTFRHNDGPDARFYVRLMNGDHKLSEMEIPAETPELKKDYPEQTLEISENVQLRSVVKDASCYIYDQNDERIATVFEGKKLKAGKNKIRYTLNHTYGPDAQFKLGIYHPNGRKIFERLLP